TIGDVEGTVARIRTRATMLAYLDAGIDRIIFGTSALMDQNLLRAALGTYPESIAVSLDARNGLVAVKGWTSLSKLTVADAVTQLKELGLQTLIYTDIGCDGMMAGPNLDGLREVAGWFGGDLIASGGVTTLDDLRALARLGDSRVIGAIVGRALYENAFTLADALTAAAGPA
ncbi:MAG TPA: HisA/HisF-related TIM barrel protein, partial [bacterium]|nr:HisA/HisF-related TIM barrel protein [bacterium]